MKFEQHLKLRLIKLRGGKIESQKQSSEENVTFSLFLIYYMSIYLLMSIYGDLYDMLQIL